MYKCLYAFIFFSFFKKGGGELFLITKRGEEWIFFLDHLNILYCTAAFIHFSIMTIYKHVPAMRYYCIILRLLIGQLDG